MKLTIIGEENVYEQEVSQSMDVQDVIALIAAEAELPHDAILLSSDSGEPLSDGSKSLATYGLTSDATLFLTLTNQASSSSSTAAAPLPAGFPSSDAELERMRLQALGNPRLMEDLRAVSHTLPMEPGVKLTKQRDPEFAQAVTSGRQFREAFTKWASRARSVTSEKDRMTEALNADPYDIEAQKKIEEAIRMERVYENMEHAMEYSPESFGNVTMLYIDVEVNGHPVKAFVDSGAQSTIISPEIAERCGIMRLLDTRFAGMAVGVGTAQILGRIHSAQIKLGNLYLPCAFSVLEGRAVDLLFGLDMLKRHQCCIDLSSNVLRINTTEIPFLAEHQLPDKARREGEAGVAEEMGKASGEGLHAGVASPTTEKQGFPGMGHALGAGSSVAGPSGSASAAAPSRAGTATSAHSEENIQTIIGLGASRAHAIQLLDAAGGNPDVAASMLFG